MIRAIGFDLWETLITDTPALARRQEEIRISRITSLLASRGYGRPGYRVRDAYLDVWDHCYDLYWSGDIDIPTRQQIFHLLEKLGLDPAGFTEEALEEFDRAYGEAAIEVLPELVPDAVDAVRWARAEGLKVGLISNTGRTPGNVLREVLARHGLAPYIDAMVFSNEHGECKPRRSIFEKLCGALNVAPREMVFVGDNLYVDIYGAQQCGMKAIHFTPSQRGLAVALRDPAPELEISPEATITTLAELPAVVAGLPA